MEANDLKQSGVVFDETAHTYTLGNKQLRGITSTIIAWMFPDTYATVSEKTLKDAAEHGHYVHSCIEMSDVVGATPDCPESQAYLDMMTENGMRCIAHEYIVTDYKEFASPIDLVLEDKEGGVWLADIKTTSSLLEPKVRLQLSIYAYLFEEMNPDIKVKGIVEVWLPNQKKYPNKKPKWLVLPRTDSDKVEQTIIAFLNLMNPAIMREYYETMPSTIPSKYMTAIATIAELEKQAKFIKAQQDELKNTLLAVFKEYGVKKFDNDTLSIVYIEPGTRHTFDAKMFKEEHPDMYEEYVKETATADSIKITIKKQKTA